jgi:hypothetical protein
MENVVVKEVKTYLNNDAGMLKDHKTGSIVRKIMV